MVQGRTHVQIASSSFLFWCRAIGKFAHVCNKTSVLKTAAGLHVAVRGAQAGMVFAHALCRQWQRQLLHVLQASAVGKLTDVHAAELCWAVLTQSGKSHPESTLQNSTSAYFINSTSSACVRLKHVTATLGLTASSRRWGHCVAISCCCLPTCTRQSAHVERPHVELQT
jgi:hypothetical protein